MHSMRLVVLTGCLALLFAGLAGAQEGVQGELQKSGALILTLGGERLGMLELNVHGPEWKYASQVGATAEVKAAEAGAGSIVTGSLPVPNTEGGAVVFTETVTPGEKQVEVAYDLSFNQTLTLNGLQVSLVLPTQPFAGKAVVVRTGLGEQRGALPTTLDPARWQLIQARGTQVMVGAGEPVEITLTSDQERDIVVQDLRRWDRDEFEIRFALIAQDQGQQVSAADTHQVKVTLGFAQPITLASP